MPSSSRSEEQPDLTLRYQIQVYFPEPGEAEEWDTINSFTSPIAALRGCSECYETVKHLLGHKFGRDLEPGYVKIRIYDASEDRLILWEDKTGGLVETGEAFRPDDRSTGHD